MKSNPRLIDARLIDVSLLWSGAIVIRKSKSPVDAASCSALTPARLVAYSRGMEPELLKLLTPRKKNYIQDRQFTTGPTLLFSDLDQLRSQRKGELKWVEISLKARSLR